ncbi:MAG TPA: hypothetical protein VLW50_14200 [Streptosporangiaceae bacterium]|nr:hypothetical protein [Streptosporangiaceae bacterium]
MADNGLFSGCPASPRSCSRRWSPNTSAAGGWHAEWETLTDALRLTSGAASHGRQMLAGLQVDAERMRGISG